MGAAVSSYDAQRRQLRRNLILSVIENPENKDLLSKITGLRKLVTQHQDICATAAREAAHKFDYSPTSLDAAWHELDRLFTVYDTGRILKSAKIRKGPAACPLGHHSVAFANLAEHPFSSPHPRCGICEKKIKSGGFYCSYCNYNVCNICSVVYCSYGHVMVLWTHEESDLDCSVCNKYPITSGYRCITCDHFDVCDYCTYKEGRQAIAEMILIRMELNLKYMRDHISESSTAETIIKSMKRTVGADGYPTILHLVQFAQSVAESRSKVRQEVIMTRITKEVESFRAILCTDPDISATHARECAKNALYTIQEASRLRVLANSHFVANSVIARSSATVACPLGHAAYTFNKSQSIYAMRALEEGAKDSKSLLPPRCKMCSLLTDDGFHCSFCEYDLCQTCSVVYCSEGHIMTMWTIPEARAQRCYVCSKPDLTAGYHCAKCFLNLCDMCTRKERRLDVREKWEVELAEIIAFMRESRKKSDMAKYYHWRNRTVIKSLGVLCDYVRELRTAKRKAEKQIKYKGLIDKMKALSSEICSNADFSATAARESRMHTGPDGYYFATKKDAKLELQRLKDIIDLERLARSVDARRESGMACVLGHAMVSLRHSSEDPAILAEQALAKELSAQPEEDFNGWENSFASSVKQTKRKGPQKSPQLGTPGLSQKSTPGTPYLPATPSSSTKLGASFASTFPESPDEGETTTFAATANEPQWDSSAIVYKDAATCRACLKDALSDGMGRTCRMCEYDLCGECLVVSCRMGHVTQIWTSYDAFEICCDICSKQNLTAGYRCKTCTVDICDRCTRREVRETLKLWPKRDIRRQLVYMESFKTDSEEAKRLAVKTQEFLKKSEKEEPSMAALARMLADLETGKQVVDQEITDKKKRVEALRYASLTSDF